MSLITDVLVQTAVYWAPTTRDNYGRMQFVEPVEIKCRWEDMSNLFRDPMTGDEVMSQSYVMVDRDVILKGVLMLGTLADVVDSTVPKNNPGAYEIRRFDKTPDFDAEEYLREVYL